MATAAQIGDGANIFVQNFVLHTAFYKRKLWDMWMHADPARSPPLDLLMPFEAAARPTRFWLYLWPLPWTALGLLLSAATLALGGHARVHAGVLEVGGGWLGRRAARGVGPFKVLAITLGHVVLGCSAEVLTALRAHERVHVRQYERWGPLFVPAYLASSLWQLLRGRHPYRDNAFERPAFAAEARAGAEAAPG